MPDRDPPPLVAAGAADAIRVKICGLTRADEAVACLAAGADWIGLNFHPGSSRFVDPARARAIVSAVGRPDRIVGLFVNRPADEVVRAALALGLSIVQLHGEEPPQDLLALEPLRVVRAFRLGQPEDVRAMVEYVERARSMGRAPDAILVDALVAGRAGGTGTALADTVLDRLAALSSEVSLPPMILAGGLNPANVRGRMERLNPWMVDVASGVESSPGRKDPELVSAFIRAARADVKVAPRPPG